MRENPSDISEKKHNDLKKKRKKEREIVHLMEFKYRGVI